MFPPDEKNPWHTLGVRPIYANPWLRVEEHAVIRPDGAEGIYGLVHPTGVALGVVALDEAQRLCLVGQYRYALQCYSWEIPEGGGDPQRDLAAEAARELREETGLTARRWTHLLTLHTSNCFTSERAEVYLAQELEQGPSAPEGTERLQTLRLPMRDAVQAVEQGRITDSISVAAILATARRLGI